MADHEGVQMPIPVRNLQRDALPADGWLVHQPIPLYVADSSLHDVPSGRDMAVVRPRDRLGAAFYETVASTRRRSREL
jgi:hypothetical protein